MNILYAVHGYKPAYRVGGPILSVSAIAETLVKQGHKVVVYTTNANLDEDLDVPVNQSVNVEGVEVWYFKRKEPVKQLLPFVQYISQSTGVLYTPALASTLQAQIHKFDLVHTHLPFVYPTQAVGRSAIKAGKPLFYHQRGVFAAERLRYRSIKKHIYIQLVERPIMNRATTLIALTEAEHKDYRALKVNTPCCIIPNGINICDYHYEPLGDLFHSALPIRSDQIVILFLSRLHPMKGADLLLEAFFNVAYQVPNAILVMAGPDEQGLIPQYKNRVHEVGLADRVLFPGMVSGKLKLDLLARADLFCLPSVAEGFSMAILEAMASKTPVIISPNCHFPEVKSHNAGWIVEREIEKWSAALLQVLNQPQQLMYMGKNGFELVKMNYTWERIVTRLEEVYMEGITRYKNST